MVRIKRNKLEMGKVYKSEMVFFCCYFCGWFFLRRMYWFLFYRVWVGGILGILEFIRRDLGEMVFLVVFLD